MKVMHRGVIKLQTIRNSKLLGEEKQDLDKPLKNVFFLFSAHRQGYN